MKKNRIAPSEREVLNYAIHHAPVSSREVADAMAESKGFARTTTQTLLERLRAKGYLNRTSEHGINLYSPSESGEEILKGLVGEFVQESLGGSISPFFAFLSEKRLTPSEAEMLQKLLQDSEKQEK
jgi:predicted transcriptional regulator